MATTWSDTTDEKGRWAGIGDIWYPGTIERPNSNSHGGARWDGVPVPAGDSILSSTVTLTGVTYQPSASTFSLDVFNHADMPPLSNGNAVGPFVGTVVGSGGSTVTWDVTSLVQQVVDLPGWASGNALAVRLHTVQGFKTSGSTITLSIQHGPSVQYLNAAGPVVGLASAVVPLDVERAVNVVGPVVAIASVLQPDVVAPVALYTNPVVGHAVVLPPAMSGSGDGPPLDVADTAVASAVALTPFLSRTIPPEPPPIPWERLIEDPRYEEALRSRRSPKSARVEVISPEGAVIARLGGDTATHPGTLSGNVTCRGEASIRWGCDLVLDNVDLMPQDWTDLLHPLSLNRLRIWWRIRLPDNTWGEVPVGTFHPDLTPVSDSGSAPGIKIMGSSSVAEIQKATWDVALELGGMTVSNAIETVLRDRAPWVEIAVTETSQKVPASFEPGEPGSDPWSDVRSLAHAAGMIAYEDRMGVIQVHPRPEVGPPRAVIEEGPGTALAEVSSIETDMEWIRNKVTVVSASPDVDPPVMGVAIDDDPLSPLGRAFIAGHLYHHRVENAIITTQQAAETMARNILADRAPVVTTSVLIDPHPHLDPWDTITLGRERVGLSGDYTIVEWTLGLTPGEKMQIVATTKRTMPYGG